MTRAVESSLDEAKNGGTRRSWRRLARRRFDRSIGAQLHGSRGRPDTRTCFRHPIDVRFLARGARRMWRLSSCRRRVGRAAGEGNKSSPHYITYVVRSRRATDSTSRILRRRLPREPRRRRAPWRLWSALKRASFTRDGVQRVPFRIERRDAPRSQSPAAHARLSLGRRRRIARFRARQSLGQGESPHSSRAARRRRASPPLAFVGDAMDATDAMGAQMARTQGRRDVAGWRGTVCLTCL